MRRGHDERRAREAATAAVPLALARILDPDAVVRRLRLQASGARVAAAQADYDVAARERRALERLRERRRAEFDAARERADQDELDEVNNSRTG
jgi:hypothetical protein